jgi:hypothetical protein
MQRSDLHRFGSVLFAVLLATAAGHAQSSSGGPSSVVTPSSVRRGGDGVGGIEKTSGHSPGPGGQNAGNAPPGPSFGQELEPAPTWTDLGGELPPGGTAVLSASGGTTPGAALELEASGTAPLAPATLVLGTDVVNLPFKGGTLVPSPDLLLAGLLTDAQGGLLLAGTMPDALPSGLTICLQLWTVDAAGPKGFDATNALLITLP